jgi:hypothetical protein
MILSMVELPLSRNLIAIIDDEDLELVGQYKWYAKDFENGTYAARNDYAEGTKKAPRTILLHRELMNAKKGEYVDHISRDTLDNRRVNLRLCNNIENTSNQKLRVTNTSGYKGVSWQPQSRKWWARISVNYKRISLGTYDDVKDAARAYNTAAIKYHGEFARLNIIK